MRKIWSRIFLLCMACMICMCGLCLAGNGNWVTFVEFDNLRWTINPSSIKVHEWNGRKFLELRARMELPIQIEYLMAIDVETRQAVDLESKSFSSIPEMEHNNPYMTSWSDISEIVNGQKKEYFHDTCFKRAKDYRPDLIKEIREHNKTAPSLESLRNAPPEKTDAKGATHGILSDSAPQPAPGTQAQPGGNVDVTDAPSLPSGGSLEDIVGDIEYEVLDSGAVKFKIHNSYSVESDSGYYDTYYIFTKPNEYKDYPGTYMTGVLSDDETEFIAHRTSSYFGHAFDYDPKTKTFIFYYWDFGNPDTSVYASKTRLTGKNTAYEARYRGFQLITEGAPKIGSETTYKYMPYDTLPLKVFEVEPNQHYVIMERQTASGGILRYGSYFDDNKCVWYGEVRNYDHDEVTNDVTLDWLYFDLRADLMKAFLAVNGNIGQAFCPVVFRDKGDATF